MLAGGRPFDGGSPYEIMWAIQNDPLPDVLDYRDGLPSGLADLVRRMLMRDTAARISSARRVCAELAQIQKGREEPMPLSAHHAFRSPMGHGYCMAKGLG